MGKIGKIVQKLLFNYLKSVIDKNADGKLEEIGFDLIDNAEKVFTILTDKDKDNKAQLQRYKEKHSVEISKLSGNILLLGVGNITDEFVKDMCVRAVNLLTPVIALSIDEVKPNSIQYTKYWRLNKPTAYLMAIDVLNRGIEEIPEGNNKKLLEGILKLFKAALIGDAKDKEKILNELMTMLNIE